MPRKWRRSRWRRTLGRGAVRILLPVVVVAVVVGLAAGAVAHLGRASGPYHRTVDRGFAAMASAVARQADTTGAELRSLVAGAPSLDRVVLFSRLDALSAQAAGEDRAMHGLTPPWPTGGAGAGCVSAFDGRASAAASLRRLLESLLGGPSGSAPVDPPATAAALSGVAGALAQADASWSSCRHRLRIAPGSPQLGRSAWLTDAGAWTPASLGHLVGVMLRAPGLQARHALSLTTVTTSPSTLAAAGALVVPATTSLSVHAVITDSGNVDEPAVQVQVTLAASGSAPVSQTAFVSLRAGRSMTVVLGPFPTRPGSAYTLQVTAAPPSGPGATSSSLALQVATVPTTTTTTRPPTTTTTAPGHRPGRVTSTSR